MQEQGEIKMFRLKSLKSASIPTRWVVIHYADVETSNVAYTFKNGNWLEGGSAVGKILDLSTVAALARTSEVCWVVCEGMYAWLCSQGLYQQIVDGSVSLPLGNGTSNAGRLTGQFATGDPCIIDLTIAGKRLHCVDFAQFGIHDVSGISEAVQRLKDYVFLITENEMGEFKSTSASQGAARYRSHDIEGHAIYCHQMPQVRQLERDAFYGGRAEVLTLAKITEPCYDFDMVSMHPTIGLTKRFPTKLIDFAPKGFSDRLRKHYRNGKHIIAKVRLRTPSPDYPLRTSLPGESDRPLTIYGVGEFTTTLCHPEFSHAIELDRIIDVEFWAAYDTDVIFRENSEWYFDTKHRLGELGLTHMAGSLKVAQNSMYGNLGRRGRRWMDTTKWTDAEWGMWWGRHPTVGNVVQHRAVYGVHQYLDSGQEPENSCPAISATMFSYSRMWLLRMIQTARLENVHYYDHDGLVVNAEGAKRLENYPVPLKVKWVSKELDIRGIKYYCRDDLWVHAGVPAWAERLPDGSARFSRHEPFNFGMWRNCPFMHKYVVAKNDPFPAYRHGVVGPDGRVSPLVLPLREFTDNFKE